ncbi:hypothetical protein Clacol_004490 [Clathrus columnatus]|uniref:Carboxypeptidase n=1 Tax=Clathrus columnatus TaxID=1419009 RepID=A0AAV5AAK9_9AGAM|nr:hypothetical protein Clacol_004490 [Clathrus columnatus]
MSVSGSPIPTSISTSTTTSTSSSAASISALELNNPASPSTLTSNSTSNPCSAVASPHQKEIISRDDASSPSLSSSPSSSSATQPSTPVHASNCTNMALLTTTMTPTSPSSVNHHQHHIMHSESIPSKNNKLNTKLHAPLTPPELDLANSHTTTHHVRLFQVFSSSQPPSSVNSAIKDTINTTESSSTNNRDSNSLSKAQIVSPNMNMSSSQAIKVACSTNTPNPLQTTNVYINGLPPNFKAEQLYALASQFGTVLSCRTFTRQLSDHPSGYGFVLFDTIDSAQQCIEVLRSHHNLHPTFAKQAHKINRITADPNDMSPTSTDSPSTQTSSVNAQLYKGTMGSPITPTSIEDATGAEIYIEGLPITIDVPTLRVLLAPHAVKNSRFFADTRVQPPQLVASVKLESQAAAGDVRARLHGRTIRGYSNCLQVYFGNEFALRLASTQITSPQANSMIGSKISIPSGLPTSTVEDPFADSEDPFVISLAKSPKVQYMSPPSHVRFTKGQNIISPGTPRPQAGLQQQLSHPEFSNQNTDQFVIPPQLQPLSTTLNELQAQLDNLKPLLLGYNQSNAISQFATTSPLLNQQSNSYNDAHNNFPSSHNAFQSQARQNGNATTNLRSPDATSMTTMRTNGKMINGNQLNPLAHTYSLSNAVVGTGNGFKHYRVDSSALPNATQCQMPSGYAGSIPVNRPGILNNTLFMWALENTPGSLTNESSDAGTVLTWFQSPWAIWLNGGPGSSSLIGLFLEASGSLVYPIRVNLSGSKLFQHGPCLITNEFSLASNPSSLHTLFDVVYIDQPVGTGFSTSSAKGFIVDEDEMGRDFMGFLTNLVAVFPSLATRPLYLIGESYAGTYIPYITKAYFGMEKPPVKIQHTVIGDGTIQAVDPAEMIPIPALIETYPQLVDFDIEVYKYFREQSHLCGYDVNLTFPQKEQLPPTRPAFIDDGNVFATTARAAQKNMDKFRQMVKAGRVTSDLSKRDGSEERKREFQTKVGELKRSPVLSISRRDLSARAAPGTIDSWYECDLFDEIIDYALNFTAPWNRTGSFDGFDVYAVPDALIPEAPTSNPSTPTTFLTDKKTVAALHAPVVQPWMDSVDYPFNNSLDVPPDANVFGDSSRPPVEFLTDLATNASHQGIRMTFLSGQTDSVLPSYGTIGMLHELNVKIFHLNLQKLAAIQNFTFGGTRGFTKVPSTRWYSDDEFGGIVHQERNVTFALFNLAGHLLASWQPKHYKSFIRDFVLNKNINGTLDSSGKPIGEQQPLNHALNLPAEHDAIFTGSGTTMGSTVWPSATIAAWDSAIAPFITSTTPATTTSDTTNGFTPLISTIPFKTLICLLLAGGLMLFTIKSTIQQSIRSPFLEELLIIPSELRGQIRASRLDFENTYLALLASSNIRAIDASLSEEHIPVIKYFLSLPERPGFGA